MTQAGLVLDGRYRLVETLGRGGMGEVWRARHERLDRDVAVKVLADVGMADPKYARLFHSEALAAARLQHPGITVVHDFGAEQKLLFLVMELLPGESLAAVSCRHPEGAALAEVCDWGAQVAEALAAAHMAGVVHRDIKPGNLMLLPGGQVKVCDFGLARLQDASASVTAAGMGTAAYMAPEQITDGAVDGRTDIYALGCTLYHLLTGRVPFEAANRWAVARKHLEETPAGVRSLRPCVPEAVDRLLRRMLAKDPAERPQHAREVAAVLARAAKHPGAPSPATPPTASGGPAAAPAASATPPVTAAADPDTGERIMMLTTGGVLIVGVWTLVVAAFFAAVDGSSIPSYSVVIALTSAPFFVVGAVLLLMFLHRNPRAGPTRRMTGLAVTGGSTVTAFLLSLLLLRSEGDPAAEDLLINVGIPLAVLSLVGPGLALMEVWQSGSLGWPPGRRPPPWLRAPFMVMRLLLPALAVVLLGLWPLVGGS